MFFPKVNPIFELSNSQILDKAIKGEYRNVLTFEEFKKKPLTDEEMSEIFSIVFHVLLGYKENTVVVVQNSSVEGYSLFLDIKNNKDTLTSLLKVSYYFEDCKEKNIPIFSNTKIKESEEYNAFIMNDLDVFHKETARNILNYYWSYTIPFRKIIS